MCEMSSSVRGCTMNFAEALRILSASERIQPETDQAWQVLRSELERIVQTVTILSEYHERAVDAVYEKIEDQVISGCFPEIHSPAAYFRRALRWRVLDLIRKSKAEQEAVEKAIKLQVLAEAEECEEEHAEELRKEAWELLEKIYKIVLRSTEPRYKESIMMAMDTLKRIHQDDYTLKEALIEKDPTLADEPKRLKQAAEKIHKAHQRLRAIIKEETEEQLNNVRISKEDAVKILALLSVVRRRPNHNSSVRLSGE